MKDKINAVHELTDTQALNILAKGGRSFYWASHFLGRQMASNAAHLYAFCRTLDDLADGDIKDGPRRLNQIHHQLTALSSGDTLDVYDPALAAFLPVLIDSAVPIQPVFHLLDGLLFDQQEVALYDQDALIKYAYQVAGTVGLLMCPILGCHNQQAYRFAVDMGIAMQLTNIARDVLEDAHLGRRYLPGTWVDHLSVTQILKAAKTPQSKEGQQISSAIIRLIELADHYYQNAMKGLVYLPARAHLAIGVAARVYRKIGKKLQYNQVNWADGRTVTTPAEKLMASLPAAVSLPRRWVYRLPVYQGTLQAALKGYLELDSLS